MFLINKQVLSLPPKELVRKYSALLAAAFETGLILFGLWRILRTFPLLYFYDGIARLEAMRDLLHGKVSPIAYSFVGPLFSLPLWLTQRWHLAPWWEPDKYNVFLFMGFLLITYVVFHKHIDHSLLRKFFLILIVASMFSDQVKFYGGETFTATFVGFGALAISLDAASIGWVTIVLGVINTPASIAGLIVLVMKKIWDNKRWRYGLAVVAAGALIMTESWIRRGNPLSGGYGDQAFSTPFILGLVGILFSFGKGLIFFTPGIFLPVKKNILSLEQGSKEKLYAAYTLWISFVVGLILIYASWWAWDGALFWGPRFFLIASIPASFAIAVRLRKPSSSFLANLLTLIVFALSLWVGINGAIFDLNGLMETCSANGYQQMPLCQYDPHYSVLWRPILTHASLDHNGKVFVAYTLFVFAYLTLPLVTLMVKQAAVAIQGAIPEELHGKFWPF